MSLRPFLLAVTLPFCAHGLRAPAIPIISNLGTPGPQGGGIGDLETVLPGTGYGVGFVTGDTATTVSSVTLELYGGYSPAGFHVQVYTFGPPPSGTTPGWPFVLYGNLDQVALDPRPTLWPGATAYYDFSPGTSLTLAPHSAYVVTATEDANGNDNNALRFGYSQAYTVAPGSGWQLYIAQNMNQWYLDPNFGGWLDESQQGFGMVMELNGAFVPEPATLGLWLLAATALAARGMREGKMGS
jgi:hypothetical protein